jgi:hypothetical protein
MSGQYRSMNGIFRSAALAVSALVLMLVSANLNWPAKYSASVIEADGKGYYAWLPAIFIYQDLHFGFFETTEKNYLTPETYFDYRLQHHGKTINKYPVGTAILEMPFFLVAHGISQLSGEKVDGYSYWYPVFISIAAIFYVLSGLILLVKFLDVCGFSGLTLGLLIASLLFGTNLFYYTVGEPGMSHVYSFALSAAWLRVIQIWAKKQQVLYLFVAAGVAGLIVLVRPMNLILLAAFPLAFQGFDAIAGAVRKTGLSKISGASLLFISIAMIQPMLWYIQTGSFFIDTYPGEHFGSPNVLKFLFSFKKGAFLYTPLLFVSLAGMYAYYRNSDRLAIYWILFMLTAIITLSSWNNWWYGGSFSSRVLVEYLPLFALPLAHWIEQKKGKIFPIILLVLLVIVCQIQTYQYRYFIIHWEDMNREKYLESWGRWP